MTETEKEKTDRQLIELLNELRVALPGAQVLFAFLLTAPFQARFAHTTGLERGIRVILTAFAVVFLMAPSVYHRIRWNTGGKEDVVRVGHTFFLAGASSLALGMLCAIFVVAEFLLGLAAATASVLALLALVSVTWYLLPLERGRNPRTRQQE